MDDRPSCLLIIAFLWPMMVYWGTAITAFVKLLENGVPWLKALGLGAFWPFALIDEIIRAVTAYP